MAQISTPCLFCRIAFDSDDEVVVCSSSHMVVLMDRFPLDDYHVLVSTRLHTEDFFTLEEKAFIELNLLARRVALGLRSLSGQSKIGAFWAGKEIGEHAHMHIIPLRVGLKRLFENLSTHPRPESAIELRREQAALLRSRLEDLG